MTILIPRGSRLWPETLRTDGDPDAIRKHYESGLVGAWKDPEAQARLADYVRGQGFSYRFDDIAHQHGFADLAAGKLVVPFRLAEFLFPGCYPGAAQETGDCVSHNTKNAALISFSFDICSGIPDEQTGALEIAPDVPDEGIRQGVFSPESIYWWRGYNGQGWSCDIGAQTLIEHGILLRKPYPTLNLDLTRYSGRQATLYGARSPGDDIHREEQLHNFRTVAEASTFEAIRDGLARGFGVCTCGGQGYSSTRDQYGCSRQSGRWSHAMALIGADDRALIKAIFGEPLVLVLNSWGEWNSGPRRIYKTDIDIPVGSFWCRWSEFRNRSFHLVSGAKGWVREKLSDLRLAIAT